MAEAMRIAPNKRPRKFLGWIFIPHYLLRDFRDPLGPSNKKILPSFRPCAPKTLGAFGLFRKTTYIQWIMAKKMQRSHGFGPVRQG
jgi:hypothetical protein